MAQLVPPDRPAARLTMDEGPLYRIQFRLWQISLSAVTILIAGWFWTMGPAAGLTAAFLAKHVLVAIIVAGFELPDEPRK